MVLKDDELVVACGEMMLKFVFNFRVPAVWARYGQALGESLDASLQFISPHSLTLRMIGLDSNLHYEQSCRGWLQ